MATAITFRLPIKSGQKEALLQLLNTLGNPANGTFPFDLCTETHFARWFIVEDATVRGKFIPATLFYTANTDDTVMAHLQTLYTHGATYLDNIYQCCEGYNVQTSTESKIEYLLQHKVKTQTFYVGAPNRKVPQIKEENELRLKIKAFIASKDWTGKNPEEIFTAIKQHIGNVPTTKYPHIKWFRFIGTLILLLPLVPVLIIWLILLHFFVERKEVPLNKTPNQIDLKFLDTLTQDEDIWMQNQFTQLMEVKPNFMRLYTLRFFLFLTNFLAKTLFVKGKLLGIPTIHFARWIMIDGQKRMIFLSNFDGSWQQYLGDFVDKAAFGLSAIYGNTVGFPKTLFALFKGAKDVDHFKGWSRYYQIPTQMWYSAYPDLSVINVNNNTRIAEGLNQNLTGKDLETWLHRIQ